MPSSLLPQLDDGNYSLILQDKHANLVNKWVLQDTRTCKAAFDEVRRGLNEFENFDNFDTSQINTIKQRNHIEVIVKNGFD